MTAPDGTVPDQTFAPIGDLAGRTEDEWRATITNKASGPFDDIANNLFAGLPTGMPFPLALLTAFARGILGSPTALWDTIDDLVKDIPILNVIVDQIDQLAHKVQQVIDNIINAVSTGIYDLSQGNFIGAIYDVVNILFGSALNANTHNSIQDSRLDAIGVTSGVSIFEDFSGANLTTLPNFNQTYFGPGSGQSGRTGGHAHWFADSANLHGCRNRHLTPLFTNYQQAAIGIASDIGANNTSDKTELYVTTRMDAVEQNWVEARVRAGRCEIGYVTSGVYTRIEDPDSVDGGTSGTWKLKAGTAVDDYQFQLYRNDTLLLVRTDLAHASVMNDTTNIFTGFTQVAGVEFYGWFFAQAAPPDVTAFTASDRLPAG